MSPFATDISLEAIARATTTIDPVFRRTPQYEDASLSDALKRRVLVKVETTNPVRSFKGRGADYFMRTLKAGQRVACESAGNFGAAIAYTGVRRGIEVRVFVARGANPIKVDRMRALGATVELVDAPKPAARAFAASHARDGWQFIEDGREPAITEGAGTIGVELLESGPIDTVVVQVGDGALIAGIGLWMKAHAPATRIIGVCAERARAMADSWRAGRPMPAPADSIADGITSTDPIDVSIHRLRAVVDDIVLVSDESMVDAIRVAKRTLGLLLEPAGAAGLAAVATHDLPGERVAVILTGSNLDPALAI